MEKRISLMFGLGLLAGLVAAPLFANPGGMRAKVPFDFVVAGKIFPAGEYRIIAVPHRVEIEDAGGRKLAVVLANEASAGAAGKRGEVIFHCYHEQCFLAEVWSTDYEHGQLVSSKSERDLVKQEPGRYVAVFGEPLNQ
jgi:hypothetical protein